LATALFAAATNNTKFDMATYDKRESDAARLHRIGEHGRWVAEVLQPGQIVADMTMGGRHEANAGIAIAPRS
jgi:hypothetical protein